VYFITDTPGAAVAHNITQDLIQPNIICINVGGPLTWDTFTQAVMDGYREIAQVDGPVFLVAHINTADNPLPMGGWHEPLRSAYENRPTNLKRWIIVGASPGLRVTLNLFMQLNHLLARPPILFAPTLSEARRLTLRQRVTLSA
jgi:hypothetical protein